MEITNSDQVTGAAALSMRTAMGLSAKEFWGVAGISKAQASGYENGTYNVSRPAQRMIYLHYVCGIPTDLPHEKLVAMGKAITALAAAAGHLQFAGDHAEEANESIKQSKLWMEVFANG